MNYLTIEEQKGLLSSHAQKFADAQFADLEDHPCSATEDFFITAMSVILASVPVVAFICFMVL